MRQITIIDIAKKLGVSASTVSRALSDHPDVKESTKKKVLKLAKEYNFRLNPIAQSLKNNKTRIIGVIVPEIKHDFFSSAISGIEEVAYNSGFTILVCQSNENYEREVINTNSLIQQRVAGIIASISQTTVNSNHFQSVINHGIPLVFFDRASEDIEANRVVIDNAKGAYLAVSHLIDRSYKRIAHLAGPQILEICRERLNGYKKALRKKGLDVNQELIQYGGLDDKDGYNSMNNLLTQKIKPDAIFAINATVAIGAYQRIIEERLRIPEDIGIVGFSNNKIMTLVAPPITAVNQPSFEMGRKAAEILINLTKKRIKHTKPKTIMLNTELIVRGST
jgi:DNA-binding LacI/PurR family transcriptional regulator